MVYSLWAEADVDPAHRPRTRCVSLRAQLLVWELLAAAGLQGQTWGSSTPSA